MSATRYTTLKHVFPGQHIRHFAGATRHREEAVQYLEAKQYIPIDNMTPQDGDVTIICAGAISFPKEMYEPLWDDPLSQCKHQHLRIRSIWCVDKSDHGASTLLNEYTQGDDPSSDDFARDLLSMINVYRDQMTLPIVGIGHSMGTTALFKLSDIHPRLFSTTVVIDPVIGPSCWNAGVFLVNASSQRPDLWSSRSEAEKAFKSSKTMQKWDARVQERWLEHGLRPTPTLLYAENGKTTLTNTKANESWNYARCWFDPLPGDGSYLSDRVRAKYPGWHESIPLTHPFYKSEAMETYESLPRVRHSVLYLFPEKGPMSTKQAMEDKVAKTGSGAGGSGGEAAGMTAKIVMKEAGHLAPFEKPDFCAKIITDWLVKQLKVREEQRKFERENRDDKSIKKVALSDEWKRQAKLWYSRHMGKAEVKAKL